MPVSVQFNEAEETLNFDKCSTDDETNGGVDSECGNMPYAKSFNIVIIARTESPENPLSFDVDASVSFNFNIEPPAGDLCEFDEISMLTYANNPATVDLDSDNTNIFAASFDHNTACEVECTIEGDVNPLISFIDIDPSTGILVL